MRWLPPPKPWKGLTEEDAQKGARVRMTASGWSNKEATNYVQKKFVQDDMQEKTGPPSKMQW